MYCVKSKKEFQAQKKEDNGGLKTYKTKTNDKSKEVKHKTKT